MSKGTPHRPIRIDDETWAKAQTKAARLGTSASAKARELLTEWAEEPEDNPLTNAELLAKVRELEQEVDDLDMRLREELT